MRKRLVLASTFVVLGLVLMAVGIYSTGGASAFPSFNPIGALAAAVAAAVGFAWFLKNH
jgi:hypothetical protein